MKKDINILFIQAILYHRMASHIEGEKKKTRYIISQIMKIEDHCAEAALSKFPKPIPGISVTTLPISIDTPSTPRKTKKRTHRVRTPGPFSRGRIKSREKKDFGVVKRNSKGFGNRHYHQGVEQVMMRWRGCVVASIPGRLSSLHQEIPTTPRPWRPGTP